MSGFYLLGLAAVWLFVSWIIYLFWRLLGFISVGKPLWKAVHIFIGILLFSAWFGSAFWMAAGKKMYYDAQVVEMCKKDGGIKVYETVLLPKDRFDKYGNVNVKSKDKTSLFDEYYHMITEKILKEGDPIIIKYIITIYRREDNKILGSKITYGRGGGDLPGFWHPSTYNCPKFSKDDINLEQSIFKKEVN